MTDLLVRLLASMFKRGYPPDELSIEYVGDDEAVIRLQWWTGHRREYAYTESRYTAALKFFNDNWHTRLARAA